MISAVLQKHAADTPDKIALVGDRSMVAYSELAERVDALAQWLHANEFQSIGFQLDNGIDWAVCDLAAMSAGITVVPVPTFFTNEQTQHVLESADIELVVGLDGKNLFAVPGLPGVPGYRRQVAKAVPVNQKITFTSGSTGLPKGVCLNQSVIAQVTMAIVDALQDIDIQRHLCVLPLATLLENIAGLYAPLVKGIEIHVPGSQSLGLAGSSGLDPSRLAAAINCAKPDSLILVPRLLLAITAMTEFGLLDNAFEFIAVGGGKVASGLLSKAQALGLPVYEGYGLSECASVVTLNLPGVSKAGSVGKPLPHVQMRTNARAEIEILGGVMTGYVGEQETQPGWLGTGDLGRIDDDGFVYIEGRIKNIFVTAFGRNVNPEWVESELTANLGIGYALVVGEAQDHNLALVWTRNGESPQQVWELVSAANRRLPDYAQVHNFILQDGDFPRCFLTSNGRMKRDDALEFFAGQIAQHYQSFEGVADVVL